MAQQKATAIRLGTTGKAEVKSDFGEVRAAGEAAFKGIAERARETSAANDTQVRRLVSGYERAVAEMEAADRRRAAATDKLNTITPRTAIQSRIDGAVGTGYGQAAGSARESAAALRELLALEDAQQAKVLAIKAALDPLAAAQNRYNAELAEARALKASDAISSAELAQYELLLKQRLDETTQAQVRAAAGARAHRAGLQQVGFQASDFFVQIGAGTGALRAFSLQAPQAIQAIALMGQGAEGSGGKFAAFAKFMGTGWGAAITVGVSMLGLLATALHDTDDAEKDTKKSAEQLVDAFDFQQGATREVINALDELIKKQREANEVGKQSAIVAYDNARADLTDALAKREKIKALIDERVATQKVIEGLGEDSEGARILEGAARARLGLQDGEIARLTALVNLKLPGAVGEVIRSPAQATYDRGLVALNKEWDAKRRVTAEDREQYKLRLAKLEADKRAAEQAERDARRHPRGGGAETTAGEASAGDMTALLKQLFPGVTVKDPKKHSKYVAGTTRISDHWTGRALDFTIPGMMAPGNFDAVKERLLAAGVEIRRGSAGNQQFFGPGHGASKPGDHDDHYHLAWKGRPSPESADRTLEQAAEQALRRQRDFEQAREALDVEELQLRRAGITDIDAIAVFDKQRVAVEEEKYRLAVASKVRLGDLTTADAHELLLRRANVAELETEAIERRRQADQLRAGGEIDDDSAAHKHELLDLQGGLVRTAKARRAIELEILALEKEQARKHYEQTIALGKLGQATDAQVKIAEAGLRNLDRTFGLREQGAIQQTAGPLEAYVTGLKLSHDEIYERVEGFAVDELEWFRKGLGDAVSGMLGIHDPLLAQLLDLFIEQVIIRPIAEALQRQSSSGGGGGVLGQIFSTLADVAVSVVGGGGFGSKTGSDGGSGGAKSAGKNALGTEYSSGGLTWLAENGPELVELPRGSKVSPAAETRRLLRGANDNSRPVVMQHFDLSGAVVTEDLLAEMDRRSQAAAAAATQSGISALLDQNRRSYGALFGSGRS